MHQKNFIKSWEDLGDALETAEYGQRRLFLTDYHLEACRNIEKKLAVGNKQLANKDYQIIEDGESLKKEEIRRILNQNLNRKNIVEIKISSNKLSS